jgi:hypothetical protein
MLNDEVRECQGNARFSRFVVKVNGCVRSRRSLEMYFWLLEVYLLSILFFFYQNSILLEINVSHGCLTSA